MAKRILIVDDHAATRVLIRSLLDAEKGQEYESVEAATGSEALMAVERKGPFDLILLDVNLPDMEGYEVCRLLRKTNNPVPVVFVTAKGELKDFRDGREAGGDSYIVKPIARAALRSIVNLFTSVGRGKAATPEASG